MSQPTGEPKWQEGAGGLLLLAAAHETSLLSQLEEALPIKQPNSSESQPSPHRLLHPKRSLLLTLLFLPAVGLHRFWELRSYTGGELAVLTGRPHPYSYRHTERFLLHLSAIQADQALSEVLARWTAVVWQVEKKSGEASTSFYVDGHRKAVYTETLIPRGLIGRLGKIAGCRALVLLHDEQGHPLQVTTHRGDLHLTQGIPQVLTSYEQVTETMRLNHLVVDREAKARHLLEAWLQTMGLELKPSKTRITHTLLQYQGQVGFDFLGWTIRQFAVGKTHTAKNPRGKPLGFKTIITPSKEAVKRHLAAMKVVVERHRHAPQEKLIHELNRVNRGWANYHRRTVAAKTFQTCDNVLYLQLRRWAKRRHPHKGGRWIANKYWHVQEGKGWQFRSQETTLWKHSQAHVQRHIKVKGAASPYDGDLLYWSQRLKKHPLCNGVKGVLLRKQQGKCRWCELLFQDTDVIEIDHITPKSEGGGEELSNKFLLHRHCHDERHARRVKGICDKGTIIEEPDAGKLACPVLKPSGGGDPFA